VDFHQKLHGMVEFHHFAAGAWANMMEIDEKSAWGHSFRISSNRFTC
jgi:hypothetical protein